MILGNSLSDSPIAVHRHTSLHSVHTDIFCEEFFALRAVAGHMMDRSGNAMIRINCCCFQCTALKSALDLAHADKAFGDIHEREIRQAVCDLFKQRLGHFIADIPERAFNTFKQFGDKRCRDIDSRAFGIGTIGIGDDAVMPARVLIS